MVGGIVYMFVKCSKAFYDWDKLTKTILFIGIFLLITRYAWILGTTLIIYSIWRSRWTNVNTRNKEKFVFEDIEKTFYHKINYFKENVKIKKYKPVEKFKEKRKYIITSCPKCTQKLRLPRGKGKIIVTCSKCSSEFRLKT